MRFPFITICFILLVFSSQTNAQPPQISSTRPSLTVIRRAGIFPIRAKITREQKRRLSPNSQDLAKYRQFLQQPQTGIFRLMPDLGCSENINVVRVDEPCLNAIPESSFYSFREREHTIETLSDIRLKNGYLISDGILAQGILVKLGPVEIEKVTLESDGLKFLKNFSPQTLSIEAQKQYLQVVGGVKIGRHEYRKFLRAEENTTYALRVVAYRGNVFRSFRGFRFDLLEGDKRIDLTLAFSVIRKETDGTVTLLWKELERRESPRLKFPKKQDNSAKK